MKVALVVTHLLGTGHLSRALTLARAFAQADHDATVVSGGMPAPHLDATGVALKQLRPLRSDGVNFTRLLDDQGALSSPELMQNRMQHLEQIIRNLEPDVLITELYPFGRRVLSEEFLHLLKCARNLARPPLVCASVRDILAPPSKPIKAVKAEEIITSHYNAVLVHSDPDITPLDVSWPVSETLGRYLHYTGFVAPPPPARSDVHNSNDILVSAGGGDVGAELFAAALDAARLDQTQSWHVLVGGAAAQQRVVDMQPHAPANVRLEPARPDFRQLLQSARASVSMAGYNTALDILQTGTPAVFVPFDAGGEVEQSLRAQALSLLPGISVLANAHLSGRALLEHLEKVTTAPARPPQTHGMTGAEQTVRIVENLKAGNP